MKDAIKLGHQLEEEEEEEEVTQDADEATNTMVNGHNA
jgi:hypothetical protein